VADIVNKLVKFNKIEFRTYLMQLNVVRPHTVFCNTE